MFSQMFMRFVISVSLAALLATSNGPAFAAARPKSLNVTQGLARRAKLENSVYVVRKAQILGYGWRPFHGHCLEERNTCTNFPEVGSCSVSFPVYCGLKFERLSRCLMITTAGEGPPGNEPGEPIVSDVVIRRGSCPTSD